MEDIDLSVFFTTKAQATDFLARISNISQAIYQTTFNLDSLLLDQFGIQKKDAFLRILRDKNIATSNATALKTFFDTLSETISSLPVLTVTLAFEPKEQTLRALSEWCLVNIKKQLLFDVSVDATLIAGAVISFNGKFFDFSIKPKVTQLLQQALTGKQEQVGVDEEGHTTIQNKHQAIDTMHLGR